MSGIRTVFAFGGEKAELERYKKRLLPAEKAAKRKGVYACIGDAITRFLYFGTCSISFWFGIQWVHDDRENVKKTYTAAAVITVSLLLKDNYIFNNKFV